MTEHVFETLEHLEQTIATGILPPSWCRVPEEIYHASSPVGISSLKAFHESPAKFAYERANPRQPTPSMVLGSAIHCAVLEPDLFNARYVMQPSFDRRTKAGKTEYEEWLHETKGRVGLDEDVFKTVKAVYEKLFNDELYKRFVTKGVKEAAWFSKLVPSNGLWIKGKTDNWIEEYGIVVDIKTTECAEPNAFKRDITKYLYFVQAAFYMDLIELVTGRAPKSYVIIAIEKTKDMDFSMHEIPEEALDAGRKMYARWLVKYTECMESGVWPGYERAVNKYEVPNWFLNTVDNQIDW